VALCGVLSLLVTHIKIARSWFGCPRATLQGGNRDDNRPREWLNEAMAVTVRKAQGGKSVLHERNETSRLATFLFGPFSAHSHPLIISKLASWWHPQRGVRAAGQDARMVAKL
jgi:hypothetical protein